MTYPYYALLNSIEKKTSKALLLEMYKAEFPELEIMEIEENIENMQSNLVKIGVLLHDERTSDSIQSNS